MDIFCRAGRCSPAFSLLLLILAGIIRPLCASTTTRVGFEQPLSHGWKFLAADPSGAQRPDLDDSVWETVTLPHTWNALDGQDGGNDYRRAPSWYRLHLNPSPDLSGKTLYLRFEGAATVVRVYVNGKKVGEHAGNFGAFCVDVTDALVPGQENVVAVRADNSRHPHIAPLGGDFTICGGLYRPVYLLARDRVAISPLDFASPGIFWKQVRATSASAELEPHVQLRNAHEDTRQVRVRFSVSDGEGKLVVSTESFLTLPGRTTTATLQRMSMDRPRLWNGRLDPYLYSGTVEVYEGERLCDRVVQRLGLRSFAVDPERGFLLNGSRYPLYGVNRHQDRMNKGWAIGPDEYRQDMEIMLEMGCTAVRLAHYQHAREFYELCDEKGLVVWAELPLVDAITSSPAFVANARQQLAELIKQGRNHPSICFWGLFNELGEKGDDTTVFIPLVADLNKLAHELDPTRLTTGASHMTDAQLLNRVPDIIAFNKYKGWYGKSGPEAWGAFLDEVRTAYRGRPIGISEYGAGGSIAQHEVPPRRPDQKGPWHPEEYQSLVHEEAWKAMKSRSWLWGVFIWNGFDFGSDRRQEGDSPGRNDKGLVTYDRKIRKDAWYFYQANWTTAPMVHIASRRFNPRPARRTQVKVYSNCERVELRLNGRSLGTREPGEACVFAWDNVSLSEGLNRVEAVGWSGKAQVKDVVEWTGQGRPILLYAGVGMGLGMAALCSFSVLRRRFRRTGV